MAGLGPPAHAGDSALMQHDHAVGDLERVQEQSDVLLLDLPRP